MNGLIVVWRARNLVDLAWDPVRPAIELREAEVEPPMINELVVRADIEPLITTD